MAARRGLAPTRGDDMHKLTMIALVPGALLPLIAMPTAAAAQPGWGKRGWVWGPPGCVRIWSRRARETRYGGAPRCRRIPA
jgi:hypothetical protein